MSESIDDARERCLPAPLGAAAETSLLTALPADGEPYEHPAPSRCTESAAKGHAPVELLCFHGRPGHGRPGDLRHEQVLLPRDGRAEARRKLVADVLARSSAIRVVNLFDCCACPKHLWFSSAWYGGDGKVLVSDVFQHCDTALARVLVEMLNGYLAAALEKGEGTTT